MAFPALTPEEIGALQAGECPDCGAREWEYEHTQRDWRCTACGSLFDVYQEWNVPFGQPGPMIYDRLCAPSIWRKCPGHDWKGERIEIGGLVSIATCSLCGSPALPASEITALRKAIR